MTQKNNSLRCHFSGASSGTRRKPKGFRNREQSKGFAKSERQPGVPGFATQSVVATRLQKSR